MTTAETSTPSSTGAVYNSEEREAGLQVRSIFLRIFQSWKPEEFAGILRSGKAYDPVYLWREMANNPITGVGVKIIQSRVTPENVARIFQGFNIEEALIQIRNNRQDLFELAQSTKGRYWIQFYIDGFKRCICPHKGYVVREGNVYRCRLCGKEEQG